MPPKSTRWPQPDLSRPGQWLPVTRESHPQAFRTPDEMRLARAEAAASMDHLHPAGARGATVFEGRTAAAEQASGDEDEQTPSEVDDDETGTFVPRPAGRWTKGKGKQTAAVPVEDEEEEAVESGESESEDALGVDDQVWTVGNPKTQPLSYYIHNDATGGFKAKALKFTVDFNSAESVKKANKTRRLEIWRAKKRHGLVDQMKRASTFGREYTDENNQWVMATHRAYAASNGGVRIPWAELTDQYNARFPAENRSQASLTSHVDRQEEIKDLRNSYNVR